MEILKPNNSDTKQTKFRTDYELMLERCLYRYRQIILDLAKEQIVMAKWENSTNVGVSRRKWIFTKFKTRLRFYLSRQLVQNLKIADQEIEKMKNSCRINE